jgi:nucleoside-diphosphate-sugar epimerase
MKIAITGMSGYIGQRLVKTAIAAGHQIVALTRKRPILVDCVWIPYSLSFDDPCILPGDIDVVFHLAANTGSENGCNDKQEILAAELLIAASRKIGAAFIFISSQTARSDAPTAYGRTKWQIEQRVLEAGQCVVRPGQVYGGPPLGLFGDLTKITRNLPVLPAFFPAPKIQAIHVDDLATGLLKITERKEYGAKIVHLGNPMPITFTAFLRAISVGRLHLWRAFIPVPTLLVKVMIRLAGNTSRIARLNSLFDLRPMDTEADLRSLGLALRSVASGMHPTGDDAKRRLIMEAQIFFYYVLHDQSGKMALRQYVRAIESLRDGKPLMLPNFYARYPILLALIDRRTRDGTEWEKEFMWRLDAATVLSEATPAGARRMLIPDKSPGFTRGVFYLAYAVMAELMWRIASILLKPVTRAMLPVEHKRK